MNLSPVGLNRATMAQAGAWHAARLAPIKFHAIKFDAGAGLW
jgi:hypothetical protein